MPKQHLVILQPSGRRGHVDEGLSLREAARQLGVEIESICAENATCGKCKVVIEEGAFERYGIDSRRDHLSPPGEVESAYFKRRPKLLAEKGWEIGQVRLSCQAKVLGDVLVHVPEESRGNKQIVRKSAREREIEIKPSIRKYYLELKPPDLEKPLADWERLSGRLEQTIALVRRGESDLPKARDLTIDYRCMRELGNALRAGSWNATVSLWQDREVIRVQPGYVQESYGAAVDIGSTTIALYLCELSTGEILAAESEMNPQIVYGEDVMSRIQYAINEPEGLEVLHKAITQTLNQLLKQAVKRANVHVAQRGAEQASSQDVTEKSARQGPETPDNHTEEIVSQTRNHITTDDILEIVFVGNTTMHHLLLDLPPNHLGRAPYVPTVHSALDVKARELGLQVNPAANAHILPTIASFIGADTSGVLIAEEPHKQDENWLIIDVGTNAELVLGNSKGLVCTSTPTGPALEGAHIEYGMRAAPGAIERVEIEQATLEPRIKIIGEESWNSGVAKGICGSAIIDAVSEMFRTGIIDARGRFHPGLDSKRIRDGENGPEYVVAWAGQTSIGRDIPISLKDIRQIQLAKGALYVAARTLLKAARLERPDKLILAGGFGSIIDKTRAMVIGMIPDLPLEDVYAVGNAAGDGARIALLNVEKRREAAEVAQRVRRYELPADPEFQNQFMLAMNFPHMSDPFPHIAHLIPEQRADPMAKKLTTDEHR
jgi:uncharacterized 2Fe-2S/4Fe-4S cluster protein (DUF4445 family)